MVSIGVLEEGIKIIFVMKRPPIPSYVEFGDKVIFQTMSQPLWVNQLTQ